MLIVKKGKPEVNSSAVRGEPGTGFEKGGDLGEFECANCKFFSGNLCSQPDMKKLSKQPRSSDGFPIVGDEDCCDYVYRVGCEKGEDD